MSDDSVDGTPLVDIEYPQEHVALITLNRPERMNAYNESLLRAVVDEFEELADTEAIRAIVVTGAGDAFCAGVDLKDMPLSPEMEFDEYETGLGLFQNVVRTIRSVPIPVIAAINGYALGAGCDTALACDFRIAAEGAVLGETFIDVGFVPGDGGAFLLPRLIGEERAKELIYTGKKLTGPEIVDWDLARQVVSDDSLLDVALEFADTLAAQPPVAISQSKGLVNESFEMDLDSAFRAATRAQRICSQTRDHQEAVEAFQEEREPSFEGR